jgi:hypothetical protein
MNRFFSGFVEPRNIPRHDEWMNVCERPISELKEAEKFYFFAHYDNDSEIFKFSYVALTFLTEVDLDLHSVRASQRDSPR